MRTKLSRLCLSAYFVSMLVVAWNASISRASAAAPPGVVIDHSPASSGVYIGSPSLAVLPNGKYIASHDGFGPNHEFGRTYIFESDDAGESWQPLSQVDGQGASTLFSHEGSLYLFGTGEKCVAIRRSQDGGRTWTTPADENSGVLITGGSYHTGPTPVLIHGGRIWRAMEESVKPHRWGEDFRAFLMSAPADGDLLKASNWTTTRPVATDSNWLNGTFRGWLEGNAVAAPDGEVVNVLRVWYLSPEGNQAAVIRDSPGNQSAGAPAQVEFIEFPGAAKKFTIRFDPVSKHYWSLTNFVPKKHRQGGQLHPGGNPESTRNTLTLISSPDLKNWTIESVLLYHPDTAKHGFQYIDWQYAGDDIVAVCRMSFDDEAGGAHDMHDANFLTFHRVKNFRGKLDSPVEDAQHVLQD